MKSWKVYMVRCADGTLYTGISNDLPKRIEQHNLGKGSRYTRARLPVVLAYQEKAKSQGDALRREAAIKRMSRQEKLRLVKTSARR